jgi:hypothetical protein
MVLTCVPLLISQRMIICSYPADIRIFSAVGCHSIMPTRRLKLIHPIMPTLRLKSIHGIMPNRRPQKQQHYHAHPSLEIRRALSCPPLAWNPHSQYHAHPSPRITTNSCKNSVAQDWTRMFGRHKTDKKTGTMLLCYSRCQIRQPDKERNCFCSGILYILYNILYLNMRYIYITCTLC